MNDFNDMDIDMEDLSSEESKSDDTTKEFNRDFHLMKTQLINIAHKYRPETRITFVNNMMVCLKALLTEMAITSGYSFKEFCIFLDIMKDPRQYEDAARDFDAVVQKAQVVKKIKNMPEQFHEQ